MNFINNFNISFSYSPYLLAVGIILIVLFSLYVYSTTLPAISPIYKLLLISLRSLGLSLILLLLFEPNISYKTKEIIKPTNLVFIDNSKSISKFASANEILGIKKFTKSILDNSNDIINIFQLGKHVKKTNPSQIDSLNFSEPSTNLSPIFSIANKTNNLASIILISDGIITEGKAPNSQLQKLGVPIYTIGVGDTTTNNDIRIERIESNKFIYTGVNTIIEATIKHNGFSNKNVIVKLLENNNIIEQKPIMLSSSEINRVSFNYRNKISGEHKITISVTTDKNEKNKSNNLKSKIINIADTKKKIFLISGSPNSDLSVIVGSLESNKDFEIESIVQLGLNKFYRNKSSIISIKDADIIFLINFPTKETTTSMMNKVANIISEFDKPIFYCLSSNVDYNKLNLFEKIIPFKVKKKKNTYEESQVIISNQLNNLLGKNENKKNEWAKLAPINVTNSTIIPKVSSEILLTTSKDKVPIIFTNNIANKKSIVLNAYNFWRWKLKVQRKGYKLFDNFILNSVKWLSIKNDDDRFNVYLSKKSYNLGETIFFSASVYDETLQPLDNASIQLEVNKNKLFFNNVSNGQYKCEVNIAKSGLYNYKVKLLTNSKAQKTISGKFNIEPIEIELAKSRMNKELLVSLSHSTKGNFFSINNSNELIDILNNRYKKNIKVIYSDNELILSSLETILFIIIFLFGTEWLIRKILKML